MRYAYANMSTLIEFKGYFHYFKKPSNMTDKMFLERSWFIVKNNTIANIENFANVWISYKYYNALYDEKIMAQIKALEQNMYSASS